MICEYQDGFKVDYTGSLRITRGDNVNVFINSESIPSNYKGILDWAMHSHNCHDMRRVAEEVSGELGKDL